MPSKGIPASDVGGGAAARDSAKARQRSRQCRLQPLPEDSDEYVDVLAVHARLLKMGASCLSNMCSSIFLVLGSGFGVQGLGFSRIFKNSLLDVKGCLQRHGREDRRQENNKAAILSRLNVTTLRKSFASFLPAQRQLQFLTAKTADSGLENKNILKLDEKLV